ncbi:major capsid protein [Eubacteriales bacterium OttesenSCG-928-K08]|nr:major capsid protein [Eubacteriales bacterium OttesenSCG-928-K08]
MPINVSARLYELFNAVNIAGYYNTKQEPVRPYLGATLFPPTEVVGRKLSFITGRAGAPIALRASALDANAPLRSPIPLNVVEAEMPFFREGMQIKESIMMDLAVALQTTNEALWRPYIEKAYDGAYDLILGADATVERMRMALLSTGVINILDEKDNVPIDIDYGFDTASQMTTLAGTAMWSNTATSDPMGDLEKAMIAANIGSARVIMTRATFNMMRASEKLRGNIFVGGVSPATVTPQQVQDYFSANYDFAFTILEPRQNNYRLAWDAPTADIRKFFPDGVASVVQGGVTLGETVYGSTPEGLTADMEGAQTEIVNTGVAVRTYTTPHTVNVNTVVSETVLPSFPEIGSLHIINAYTPA